MSEEQDISDQWAEAMEEENQQSQDGGQVGKFH